MSEYLRNNIYFYSISEENMKLIWRDTSAFSFSGLSSKFPEANWDKFKNEYNRTFTYCGWLGRKVIVVPKILWHGVILTIYRLVGILITKTGLVSSHDCKFIVWHKKQPFYLLARDLQLTILYVYSFFFDRSAKWYIDAVNLEKLRYSCEGKSDCFFVCAQEYFNYCGNNKNALDDTVNLYHIMIQHYGRWMKDYPDCVRLLQSPENKIVPLLINRIANGSSRDYKTQFQYLIDALTADKEVKNTLMQVIGDNVKSLSDFSEEIKKSFFISWLEKARDFTQNKEGNLRNQVFGFILENIPEDLKEILSSTVITHFLINCYKIQLIVQIETSDFIDVYLDDDQADISVASFVDKHPPLLQSLLNELESNKFKDDHFINLIKKLQKTHNNEQLRKCCVARAKKRYCEELKRIIEVKLNPQQQTKETKSMEDFLIPSNPIPKGIDNLAEKIVNAIMEKGNENNTLFLIPENILKLCETDSDLKNVLTEIFNTESNLLEISALENLLKIENL